MKRLKEILIIVFKDFKPWIIMASLLLIIILLARCEKVKTVGDVIKENKLIGKVVGVLDNEIYKLKMGLKK